MLVEREQVLDFGRSWGEAWIRNSDHLKEIEMIDNASLAAASIGLDAIRREQELYDAFVPQPGRKTRRTVIRSTVAETLRRIADGLEPSHRSAQPGPA
jgi:hypothetical protein